MDFKPLTMPPEEAQFLETRSLQIDEVARILNINPILLQKTEGSTTWGTAIGHFLTAFGKFTIAGGSGRKTPSTGICLGRRARAVLCQVQHEQLCEAT